MLIPFFPIIRPSSLSSRVFSSIDLTLIRNTAIHQTLQQRHKLTNSSLSRISSANPHYITRRSSRRRVRLTFNTLPRDESPPKKLIADVTIFLDTDSLFKRTMQEMGISLLLHYHGLPLNPTFVTLPLSAQLKSS